MDVQSVVAVISALAGIVATIIPAGIIVTKAGKRRSEAEAAKAAAEAAKAAAEAKSAEQANVMELLKEWRDLAEKREQELEQERSAHTRTREAHYSLLKEKANLEVEMARQQLRICNVEKCPSRNPPTGF